MYKHLDIVLAIDPGPDASGWAILRVDHTPGIRTTLLSSGTMLSTQHDFLVRLGQALGVATGAENVVTVAIETPAGYAFQPARVPYLLRTAAVAGGMAWAADAHHVRVMPMTAQQVRKILCGKANADDPHVKQVVEAEVFGAVGARTDHARDAVAIGAVAARLRFGSAVLPTPQPKKKTPGRGRSGRAKGTQTKQEA